MFTSRPTTIVLLRALCVVTMLNAAAATANATAQYDGSMLNATIGRAQIFDNGDKPMRYGIEYRGLSYTRWKLIPAAGFAVADSGNNFVYTDLRHDFWLGDRWVLIPSIGVGLFNESRKIQLGNELEFRSGIELAYRVHGDYRVGLALFHLSNGGLSNRNPGTEVLVVSLCVPLRRPAAKL